MVHFFPFQYNNHEIRSGKHIGVCISVANNRLFVGSIPKSKTKEQILEEFSKVTGKLDLCGRRCTSNTEGNCILLHVKHCYKHYIY